MESNEILEPFVSLPILETRKEKYLALLLAWALSYGYIIVSLFVWTQSNWYIALSSLLLSYIISGIISSKLLHHFVPYSQHEFAYSSKELATWVVSYY